MTYPMKRKQGDEDDGNAAPTISVNTTAAKHSPLPSSSSTLDSLAQGSPRLPSDTDGTKPFEYLVVLDFEWNAGYRRGVLPIMEIIQFPSVLVSLRGENPHIVSQFDSYVRPIFGPILSHFIKNLTGIAQSDVCNAPTLTEVLPRYLSWIRSHGLVVDDGENNDENATSEGPRWAFCTWGDVDIKTQLSKELRYKNVPTPPCFRSWINLTKLYREHYRDKTRALQKCVNNLGMVFDGRPHNGLDDSKNTARIVLHMAKGLSAPILDPSSSSSSWRYYPKFVFRTTTSMLDQGKSKSCSRKRARVDEGGAV